MNTIQLKTKIDDEQHSELQPIDGSIIRVLRVSKKTGKREVVWKIGTAYYVEFGSECPGISEFMILKTIKRDGDYWLLALEGVGE